MHPISYIEKRFLWDWVEQQDGETWCDAFCEHLTEHGFHWVKKHVDSQVWTGVSRTRLYILFADDTIGGQLAGWLTDGWLACWLVGQLAAA